MAPCPLTAPIMLDTRLMAPTTTEVMTATRARDPGTPVSPSALPMHDTNLCRIFHLDYMYIFGIHTIVSASGTSGREHKGACMAVCYAAAKYLVGLHICNHYLEGCKLCLWHLLCTHYLEGCKLCLWHLLD